MHITVTGKNFEVTDALKSHAQQRLHKVARYFDHVLTANVILSTERNWHIAEVTLHGNGFDMFGKDRGKDMYHSIDMVVDKLEKQLKKQKGRVIDRSRTRAEARAESPEEAGAPPLSPEEAAAPRLEPRVETVKSFPAFPMTLEAAIKQLEALGYAFYAFLNQEN
ncbi:MAG TPA: ribosome-associated translation inhibitor RaiA, partial [Candidatus Nitrosotenuis sp.]|nr:ribosome-associated translation inhibitor RaiA [Candidatus Nitrosotenuis sp.]